MRRAAVLGSPISHSLSPVIHNAGYVAAGLNDWNYTAHECDEAGLPDFVADLSPQWAGLSLTMPLKEVALSVATEVSDIAAILGAANTLVLRDGARRADNTDVAGIVDALTEVDKTSAETVAVLGAGGTARAALGAAAQLGAGQVWLYARRPEAITSLEPVAHRLGIELRSQDWADVAAAGRADLVVSTLPKGAADELPVAWGKDTVLFDVVYDPWPTALAVRARDRGNAVVSGLAMLLWQAVRQFELFTGVAAPVEAMREALYTAR